MRIEKHTFTAPSEATLSGRLDLPAGQQPRATALLAHCFTCDKNYKALVGVSRALTEAGYAVFRFDFSGLGESGGNFAESTFSSSVEELVAAADYLTSIGRAPSLLFGHSLGGTAAIKAAPRLPSVKAVAVLNAPHEPAVLVPKLVGREKLESADTAEVLVVGRPFTIGRALISDLQASSIAEETAALGRPLLILHSEGDGPGGLALAEALLARAATPKSLVVLPGADHLLSRREDAQYAGRVLATWAEPYLGLPAPPEPPIQPEEHATHVYLGREKYRTQILADRHALTADEPDHLHGTDLGPSPYHLLLSALGACTAITVRMYADHKQLPLESIHVRLTHEKRERAAEGTRKEMYDHIEREITFAGELDEPTRERLRQIADRCPVHRTLHGGVVEVITRLTGDQV